MSEVKVDTISERTAANGVAVDGVTIKDSGLTIPSGGTLDVASGATLDVTGATVTGLSAGKVLQVVSAEYTDATTSTTSTTFVTTGVEASITPSSTSNKILLMASMSLGGSGAMSDNRMNICFLRDTTEIGVPATVASRTSVGRSSSSVAAGQMTEESILYLDSPSSTSAITYKVAFSTRSGYTTWLNRSATDASGNAYTTRGASTLVLMEIEG
jgi:hypothetical protein